MIHMVWAFVIAIMISAILTAVSGVGFDDTYVDHFVYSVRRGGTFPCLYFSQPPRPPADLKLTRNVCSLSRIRHCPQLSKPAGSRTQLEKRRNRLLLRCQSQAMARQSMPRLAHPRHRHRACCRRRCPVYHRMYVSPTPIQIAHPPTSRSIRPPSSSPQAQTPKHTYHAKKSALYTLPPPSSLPTLPPRPRSAN